MWCYRVLAFTEHVTVISHSRQGAHIMAVSDQGQLDLSTVEQVEEFQGALRMGAHPTGPFPLVADDPADGSRSVTKMVVNQTSGTNPCRLRYEFAGNHDDVWFEFEVRYTHPAAASAGSMDLFTLRDVNDNVLALLTRLTDTSTEWRAVTASTSFSFLLSTAIAKDTWTRMRLRYKKATSGANGIVQAWRFNPSTGVFDQVPNVMDHTATNAIRRFCTESGPIGDVRAATGDKIAWFRGLTWGQQQSHVGMKHHGLQFGHVCSSGSSSGTINVNLWYHFPWRYHSTSLGGVNDPPTMGIQFQYMLATGTSWTNGPSANLSPDGQNEMIAMGTVTGLQPLSEYLFRAIVTDDGGMTRFTLTTEVISCLTPSAASGEPGQLKYIFGSCAESANAITHPHAVMSRIRDENPHGFIHLGDMVYADFEQFYPWMEKEMAIRGAYRKAFVHDYDHRRLHAGAAFFPMWDDHEIENNAWGANPNQATIFAKANAAADAYWVNRRINAIPGGKGWWFDTAKCRFVMMDMRTAKHIGDPNATPPIPATVLGATQHEAVKSMLYYTGKPINFLFSPGPCAIGHGTGPDADGWNQTAMIDLWEDILDYFYEHSEEGAILIICSGDRHFTYVATDWGAKYDGRIKPEWCSSPLAFLQRDPATLNNAVSSVQFKEPDVEGVVNRYCRIEIDEAELEVTMTLVNGATGQPMGTNATSTYTASE